MVMMKQLKVGTEASDDRMERLVQPEGFSPTRLKVLVVDDDLLCLMILERMLCQCKYTGRFSSLLSLDCSLPLGPFSQQLTLLDS